MKNQTMTRLIAGLSLMALGSGSSALAALSVSSPIAPNANNAAAQLVDLLIPNASSIVVIPGTETMANIGFTGTKWTSGDATMSAIGTFAGGGAVNNLPFSSGVVLTTGRLQGPGGPDEAANNTGILGPNDDPRTTRDWNAVEEVNRRSTSLAAEIGLPVTQTQDAASLSFHFTSPTANSISFQYMFASEEYAEYVGSANNDAFAFLLKDLTVNGPVVNLAKIGTDRVSVNTVNNGLNEAGPSSNGAYYTANPFGSNAYDIEFDGMAGGAAAQKLYASSPIVPGHEYIIEMVIADVGGAGGNGQLDSAVFLGESSFTDEPPPPTGVPEPSTYVGALALVGLAARRLRRKA